jgi:hypothetical protein
MKDSDGHSDRPIRLGDACASAGAQSRVDKMRRSKAPSRGVLRDSRCSVQLSLVDTPR